MKCPRCAEEMDAGQICRKCGEAMPSTGMEVRYEDFKISELLDIKMKRGKASKKTGEKPERSEARKGSNFNKSGSEERSPSVTKLFVLIAFMIVLASLIACFLLR